MDELNSELFYCRLDTLRKAWKFSWCQVARHADVDLSVHVRLAQGFPPNPKDMKKLYHWLDEYGG